MSDKHVWLNTEAILSKFGSTKQESVENLLHYTLMKLEAEAYRKDILRAHRKGVFGDDEEFNTFDTAGGIIRRINGFPSVGAFMKLVCEQLNLTREELSSRSKSITALTEDLSLPCSRGNISVGHYKKLLRK